MAVIQAAQNGGFAARAHARLARCHIIFGSGHFFRKGDPAMFLRYWNLPEKTAEKVQNGWLRTGDLATRDEDGYFTFASRDDDVLLTVSHVAHRHGHPGIR